MFPRPHLLGLPRELRDIIYEHYLTQEDGYLFDYQSGKVRGRHGLPINISLSLSCKLIASEMHGLALKFNTITFTTGYSGTTSTIAGLFNYFLRVVDVSKAHMLNFVHPFLTPEIIELVSQEYPQFQNFIRELRDRASMDDFSVGTGSWGETPSIYRDFKDSVLILASQQPTFLEALAQVSWPDTEAFTNPCGVLSLCYVPWSIPTPEDIGKLANIITSRPSGSTYFYWERQKYSLSAAALAIHFLGSLPIDTRLQVRKIKLLEDRPAIAFPECHARGLIPFCRENSQLCIDRSVSLWRNAFQDPDVLRLAVGRGAQRGAELRLDDLNALRISYLVTPWIQEAEALPSLGMPFDCFTLVLDGDPLSTWTPYVFETLVRDAGWQSALEECYKRNYVHARSWFHRRRPRSFIYEGFPEALARIVNGTSIVRCNFDTGPLWDVEEVIELSEEWALDVGRLDEWDEEWLYQRTPPSFQTIPPLPNWFELLSENVRPEEDTIEHPFGIRGTFD